MYFRHLCIAACRMRAGEVRVKAPQIASGALGFGLLAVLSSRSSTSPAAVLSFVRSNHSAASSSVIGVSPKLLGGSFLVSYHNVFCSCSTPSGAFAPVSAIHTLPARSVSRR